MTTSVLIPTYRRAGLLMNRAIPSVLAQTDPDWDCYVIGDGTDDETVAAMTDLCARDPRFRFDNLPHAGVTEWGLIGLNCLNYGLDHATGDWIAVLGDDDEFMPRHHEILIAAAEARGVDFCYGISESPRGQQWGSWPPGDGSIANGAYVYRGAARAYRYDMNCLRDRGLNGDADMWTRMFAEGVTFALIQETVHRYHPSAER